MKSCADRFGSREDLTEQKALADEIGSAIANGPQAGEPIDEGELEDELDKLEQEKLDTELLKTGTVPVLPSGPNGESKSSQPHAQDYPLSPFAELQPFGLWHSLTVACSQGEEQADSRGGRRGGGAAEITGRDGYVMLVALYQIRPLISILPLALIALYMQLRGISAPLLPYTLLSLAPFLNPRPLAKAIAALQSNGIKVICLPTLNPGLRYMQRESDQELQVIQRASIKVLVLDELIRSPGSR